MDFLFKLGEIILIAIPIFIAIRILLILFYKKLPWMVKLQDKLNHSKMGKVIPFAVTFLTGFLCFYLSELFSLTNLQLGLLLGLFLGITNILDSAMLK